MPCTTPDCPAPMASAPRAYHAPHCKHAAARSGSSGKGAPVMRVRKSTADKLRRAKVLGIEDEVDAALDDVLRRHVKP